MGLELFLFIKAGRCSMVCHLTPFKCNNNLNAFGVYRNEHGFFFFLIEKEKKIICFAIMLLSVNWPLHLHINVQMCIIMKTAIIMIVLMLYLLGNRFWQEGYSFLLIVNLNLFPSPGFCYHWRQCATLFTQSVNMHMLSLKNWYAGLLK